MATVWVVQESGRFDISPAQKFGEIKVILPPGDTNFSYEYTTQKIDQALDAAEPGDYLLLTGDPVAIGVATALMYSKNLGALKFLKWLPRELRYLPVTVDLN